MKRHAIYFTLALAGATFTAHAAPLPTMPDAAIPVSQYITQVNTDNSVTSGYLPPMPGVFPSSRGRRRIPLSLMT